jgi:hypothetical protein
MMANRMFFWDAWPPPPSPPSGQSPSATRYRMGYRVNTVTGAVLLLVVLWPL